MSWPPAVRETIKRLHNVQRVLKDLFTDRDLAVDLLALATVCQEHLLLIGPPGTAKTEILTRYTELIDARGFTYLLTRFTEPSELFGPLDLAAFQKGTYHVRTDGMLPEAQFAFLDEVFQGSSPILNSLLGIIHERVFHNGSVRQIVPLICLVGATNVLPDDPWLQAFADRFSLRLELDPVPDEHVEDLLERGWQLESDRIESAKRAAQGQAPGKVHARVKFDELVALHARTREVDLGPVRGAYGELVRELRAEGVTLSDRRTVKGLKLIAGAALLREAEAAGPQDFWPLLHVWTRPEEADALRGVLQPRLQEAGVAVQDPKRSLADIMLDRETLLSQESAAVTESARGAHLMALNQLRREVLRDHPRAEDGRGLLRQIEEDVQRVLQQLGGDHV